LERFGELVGEDQSREYEVVLPTDVFELDDLDLFRASGRRELVFRDVRSELLTLPRLYIE
jgi:hypothetical protein